MTHPSHTETMTASDVRHHLLLLHEERALAREEGLLSDPAYVADLDEEIEACRHAYVGAAVTEIAVLRAAIDGPLQG